MRYRKLGSTDVDVSAIGLGCMGLVGWYGERDDAEARATVDLALDLGVNHLDTAAIYQNGDNERFVGAAIRNRRQQVFLASKCGGFLDPNGKAVVDNRPAAIRKSCEDSLERLGMETIDLLYLHRIDPHVPIEESVGAMADLVGAGKIRYVGLSEASTTTIKKANRTHPIAAVQSELSLWSRQQRLDIVPLCRELGISFVAYSPLGRGFLSGKIQAVEDLAPNDLRRGHPRFSSDNIEQNRELIVRLQSLADEIGCTKPQLALAWVLAAGSHVLPIVGTKRRRYLQENLLALEVVLSEQDIKRIDEILPADLVHGERYPESVMASVNR